MVNGFTPTEKKILELLSDGLPHHRKEVHGCLPDELSELKAIQPHISRIRKRLQIKGEDIICEFYQRGIHYRQVRLLPSAYNGRV